VFAHFLQFFTLVWVLTFLVLPRRTTLVPGPQSVSTSERTSSPRQRRDMLTV